MSKNGNRLCQREAIDFIREVLLPIGLEMEYGKEWKEFFDLPEIEHINENILEDLKEIDGQQLVACNHFGYIYTFWGIDEDCHHEKIATWYAKTVFKISKDGQEF